MLQMILNFISIHFHRWFWYSIMFFFFFFTINRFFLSFLFFLWGQLSRRSWRFKGNQGDICRSAGGKSVRVRVDVHANTAPRELVAMLRRYVDDWLRLSLYPHQRWTKNALFHQSNASWSRQRHCRSCALQDSPNCRKCAIVFDHDICIWRIRIL